MIRWIRALLGLHEHQWETFSEGSISDEDGVRIGTFFNLRCKHCGDVRRRNFRQ